RAHALHPVVSIGKEGLTPSVLHEIDVNLMAHELIKIRVFNDLRGAREALLHQLCEVLDATPVQHIGKLLVVWRKRVDQDADEDAPPARKAGAKRPANPRAAGEQTRARHAARKAPQARRPQSPLPRTPARTPAARP